MFKKSFHFLRYAFFTCLLFAATLFFCENFFCFTPQTLKAESVQIAFSQNLSTSSELVIESITAKYPSKVYDGTTLVELEVVVSNFAFEDNVSVIAYGNTPDANVGENKYVFFNTQNFEITSSLNNQYTLPEKTDDDFDKILFNITKQPTELTWVTTFHPSSYTYSGQNQMSTVKAYYVKEYYQSEQAYFDSDLKREPVYLQLSWTGSCQEGNFNYVYLNEFKNHGTYKATAILGEQEANFEIQNSSQWFTMARAESQIEIVGNKNFTYTGAEQDASRNATMAVLNNQEQTITSSCYSNFRFTTVSQGNNLTVQINVPQSQNYTSAETTYTINVSKAPCNINIDNIPSYTYIKDTTQYVTGATIDNTEQVLKYANNSFQTVAEGNSLMVVAYVEESENYLSNSVTFPIVVERQIVDVSDLVWSSINANSSYDKTRKSVVLANYNSDLVYLQYENATKVDAGDYVASVKIYLVDEENFELIGHVENLNWSIKKAKIKKPTITNLVSKYTGSLQYANISSDTKNNYVLINNSQTNAGNYKVTIRLKDLFNTQWADETIDDIYVDWKIEKKELDTPQFKNILVYNAKNQKLNIPESDLYSVIENYKSEVGNYESYVVLSDPLNYKWADSSSSILTLKWQIISNDNYNTATPIITIIIAVILVALASVSITLHFTIKAKRRKHKKLLPQTAQAAQSISTNTVKSTKLPKQTTTNKLIAQPKKQKEIVKNVVNKSKTNKQPVKSKKPSAVTNKNHEEEKSRKKRMISMKKKDKRKRRQEEIKKKVVASKPPAKRGRPPKNKRKK